jgi:archaellum component FlaC
MKKSRYTPVVAAVLLTGMALFPARLLPADPPLPGGNLEAEIPQARKELAQVQQERQNVRRDTEQDARKFAEYREQNAARVRLIQMETDSIHREIGTARMRYDSLGSQVQTLTARQREFDLQQNGLRAVLAEECSLLSTQALRLPPLVSNQMVVTIHYLRSELVAKSVNNVEALNRMEKIIKDLHALGGSIQIDQGISPTPELTGTCYRLRLGAFWEAVVDAKGERYAVWAGYDDLRAPRWDLRTDRIAGLAILNAVKIREGKSLPAFVDLPLTLAAPAAPAAGGAK